MSANTMATTALMLAKGVHDPVLQVRNAKVHSMCTDPSSRQAQDIKCLWFAFIHSHEPLLPQVCSIGVQIEQETCRKSILGARQF